MLKSILTGKHIGKRPLGGHRRTLEDNIGMDFKEISINARNWDDSVQDGDYWTVFAKAVFGPPGSLRHGVIVNASRYWVGTDTI